MHGELSHNLPGLATSGNRILRVDTMQPVLLRGVNRSGLEYSEPDAIGFLSAAALTEDEVREITINWRANIVRLPFNQDWALHGRRGHTAEEYLSSLDQVISWAAKWGAYTILDLQWLDADTEYGHNSDGTVNHVPPAPDENTVVLWNVLAARYRDEPAVLFDLLNEPHDPATPDSWSAWASRLVAGIRTVRPDGIILIGGVDWAFDLRDVQVDAPNIVYSAHIYSNRRPHDWKKALGRAGDVPVFVAEWGGGDSDLPFGRDLADRLRRDGHGWTAWSWSDYPHLVQAPAWVPTAFGQLVKAELGS